MSTNTTPTPFSAIPNTADPLVKLVTSPTALETSINGNERRVPLVAVPRLAYTAGYYLSPEHWEALRTGETLLLPDHPVLPAGAYVLDDAEHQLEHLRYGSLAATSLDWRAVENNEVVPAYDGPRSDHGGLFLFPEGLVDGRLQPTDSMVASVNEFDEGNLWSRQVRYRKRTVSMMVTLTSADELATFYSFMTHLRGRYRAFRYRHFVDDVERTWRLASDSFALKFYRPTLAECELRIVHLEKE